MLIINHFLDRGRSPMILFEEDWDKYPSAIIHSTTTNKSWIRMAWMYKTQFKLNNWAWPLALINPRLANVDPYDLNLDDSTKLAIMHECAINPWYFYREILRIPAKIGLRHNSMRVDRGTLATLWLYHNHIDSANVQLRQTGKTIKVEAAIIWLLTVGTFNTTLLFGTIDSSKQADTVGSIKEKLSILPDYIYKKTKGDADNKINVTNATRNNVINFAIGQKDPRAAQKAGRGFSLANKFWDEVAETFNAHQSIAAAANSSNAVIDQARELGEPHGTIFACTAGSLDTKEGEFYYNLANGGMDWNEILLDCKDEQDLKETVATQCKERLAPIVNITMTWRQLGLTKDRFDEIVAISKRDSGGDMDKVKRECYSIWSRGGVGNPLTKNQLEVIFNSETDPIRLQRTKERVILRWYLSEEVVFKLANEGRIGLGIDTSNGVNKDSCSVTLIDLATLEVVGRADVSLINLHTYGEFVSRLLLSIPNSVLVIENKSSGQSILDACILALHAAGEDPFERIFNMVYQNTEKYHRQFEEVTNTPLSRRYPEWYDRFKGLFGFHTTGSLRQSLYDDIITEAVKRGGSFIRDKELSNQMRNLIEKNNRVDHAPGGHDDAVISYLLICWFCMRGINQKRYAIDHKSILSKTVSTEDGGFSEKAYRDQQELTYLEGVIGKLEAEFKSNYNTMFGQAIRNKLVKLYSRLESLGGSAKNIDQLLEQLREETKRNKKRNKLRMVA